MGKPSDSRGQKRRAAALRVELQQNIEEGQCAYCRAPARPGKPLTREHVIPRARGGRRKDVRIIVPACAHCNHQRGCTDLIPFLLKRPRRISAFLDYLGSLSPESIRQVDRRVFAEAYAAVAILVEAVEDGEEWQDRVREICAGRALHRRRYAARRAMLAVADRLDGPRYDDIERGASCLLPSSRTDELTLYLEEPIERIAARMVGVLAFFWQMPAEVIQKEMQRAVEGAGRWGDQDGTEDGLVSSMHLDGWSPRPKRKRLRVDRRQGRPVRPQRITSQARGRAA